MMSFLNLLYYDNKSEVKAKFKTNNKKNNNIMGFPFIKYKRKVNNQGKKEEKYMAKAYNAGMIEFNELCKRMEKHCTLSKSDVSAAVSELAWQIEMLLKQGHSVRVGELGIFYPTLNSKTVDDPKDVHPNTIKRIVCNFLPSKELKNNLNETKFDLIDRDVWSSKTIDK
ncbi:MAG: HU family DNA-binding protein [Bacteroidales bacterium]|nr:HU family DNA-binding protein [Bacteroidales bacterium]